MRPDLCRNACLVWGNNYCSVQNAMKTCKCINGHWCKNDQISAQSVDDFQTTSNLTEIYAHIDLYMAPINCLNINRCICIYICVYKFNYMCLSMFSQQCGCRFFCISMCKTRCLVVAKRKPIMLWNSLNCYFIVWYSREDKVHYWPGFIKSNIGSSCNCNVSTIEATLNVLYKRISFRGYRHSNNIRKKKTLQ